MEKVPRNYSLADTVFLCNWSIARESLILVICWYYWLQLDISTERRYLKKCWYRIRSLTYVQDDTIKLVTVEIYYCCSTMRFTIKTTLLPLFITQNKIGLKKRCFFHHWLDPGLQIKDLLEYKIWNISPGFRVYAAFRPEWQWKGNAGYSTLSNF